MKTVRFLWGVVLLSLVINPIGKAEKEGDDSRAQARPLSPLAQYLDDIFFGSGRSSVPSDRDPFTWKWEAIARNSKITTALQEIANRRGSAFVDRLERGLEYYQRLNHEVRDTATENLQRAGLFRNPAEELGSSYRALLTRKNLDSEKKKPWWEMASVATQVARESNPAAFVGPGALGLSDPNAARAFNQSLFRQEMELDRGGKGERPAREEWEEWLRGEESNARKEIDKLTRTFWTRLGRAGMVTFSLGTSDTDPSSERIRWDAIEKMKVSPEGPPHLMAPDGRKLLVHHKNGNTAYAASYLLPEFFTEASSPVPGSREDRLLREIYFLSESSYTYTRILRDTLPHLREHFGKGKWYEPEAFSAFAEDFRTGVIEHTLATPYKSGGYVSSTLLGLMYSELERDPEHWRKKAAAKLSDSIPGKRKTFEGELAKAHSTSKNKKSSSLWNTAKTLAAGAAMGLSALTLTPPQMLSAIGESLTSPSDFRAPGYEWHSAFNKDRSTPRQEQILLKYSAVNGGKPSDLSTSLIVPQGPPGEKKWVAQPELEYAVREELKSEVFAPATASSPLVIPTPEWSILGYLKLTDRAGVELPASSYVVKEASDGTGYFVYPAREGETLDVKFIAGFFPNLRRTPAYRDRVREKVAPSEGILRAAERLESVGYGALPRVLRETVAHAQANHLDVKVKHLNEIISSQSLYSDIPEKWQFPNPLRSPEQRLARFLNEEGTQCSQCDGFRELSELVLAEVFTKDPRFRMKPRYLYGVSGNEIRRKDYHTDLWLEAAEGDGAFDATAATPDPRNEAKRRPSEPADPLHEKLIELLANVNAPPGRRVFRPHFQRTTVLGPPPSDEETHSREEREAAPGPISADMKSALENVRARVKKIKALSSAYRLWPTGGNETLPNQHFFRLAELMEAYGRGHIDEKTVREALGHLVPSGYVWGDGPFPDELSRALAKIADRFDNLLEAHRLAFVRGQTKAYPALTKSELIAEIRDGFREVAGRTWAPPAPVLKPKACAATYRAIFSTGADPVRVAGRP